MTIPDEHAVGQGLGGAFLKQGRRGDRRTGRLDQHRVAVGQGRGGLPERYRQREVPGADRQYDAERFAPDLDPDAGGRTGQGLAVGVERHLRIEAEDRQRPLDLSLRFGDRLADLADHQLGELVPARGDRFAQRGQRPRPQHRVGGPPFLGIDRGVEGRINGRGGGDLDLGDDIGRVEGVGAGDHVANLPTRDE